MDFVTPCLVADQQKDVDLQPNKNYQLDPSGSFAFFYTVFILTIIFGSFLVVLGGKGKFMLTLCYITASFPALLFLAAFPQATILPYWQQKPIWFC